MASNNDVKFKLIVDASGGIKVLKATEKGFKEVGSAAMVADKAIDTAAASTKSITRQLIGFAAGAATAILSFKAISAAAKGVGEALEIAGPLNTAAAGFARLQTAAGVDAVESLDKLRDATLNTVSDLELLQQANRAVVLGLPIDEFDNLTAASVKLGAALGKTASESVEALVSGVGRGNVEVLDNIGIVLTAEKAYKDWAAANNRLVKSMTETERRQARQQAALEKIRTEAAKVAEVTEDASLAYSQFQTQIERLSQGFAIELSRNDKLKKALDDLIKVLSSDNAKTAAIILADLAANVATFAANIADKAIGVVGQFTLGLSVYADMLSQLADGKLPSYEDATMNAARAMFEAQQRADSLKSSIEAVGAAADDLTPPDLDAKPSSFAAQMRDVVESLGVEFDDLVTSMEASLSRSMAQLGRAAATGNRQDIARGIGDAVGGQIRAIGSQFGPIGEFVGEFVGTTVGDFVGDTLGSLFGKDDDRKKARKAIQGFLDETLGFALDLSNYGVTWSEQERDIEQAFTGFGQILNQLAGEDLENVADEIGGALADNVGKSLNDLGILMRATGMSLEDMKEQFIGLALTGEQSFLGAQAAIQGVAKALDPGIPELVGGITEAFDNMKEAGVLGGIVTVDALSDIGAEAEELKLRTIPELAAALLESGNATESEVQKLVTSLEQYGIATTEQLKNISNEAAVAVLASLEAAEFPFAQTKEDLNSVLDLLREIPESKDVEINVRTNFDANTRQAVESGVFTPGFAQQ